MIEGRIKSFDNIDLNILVNILNNKLKPDRTLTGIFFKLLKAGYMYNLIPDPHPQPRVGGVSYHASRLNKVCGIISPSYLISI